MSSKVSPFDSLNPTDQVSGLLQVVIETPRGSRNKYDEELHLFRLNSVLPAGSAFPYDFGYVPGTKERFDKGTTLFIVHPALCKRRGRCVKAAASGTHAASLGEKK